MQTTQRLLLLLWLTACAGGRQKLDAAKARARAPLAMAVPPDARVTFLAEKPWSRFALHRQLAERLGLAQQYAQAIVGFSGMAGFDLSDPQELTAHGFDTESGIAWFTLPGDETPVIAIGIVDSGRAESTLRRVMERYDAVKGDARLELSTRAAQSREVITLGTRAGNDRLGFFSHGGFLYVRVAGPTDPTTAFQRAAALTPGQGPRASRDFLDCARRIGNGDLVVHIARGANTAVSSAASTIGVA